MKKTIILLFALHTAFSCAAQTFRMSQLKGCKWVSYELDGKVNTVWFTDSAYFDENFYTSLNKTATSKMPFYLSNTIEKVFDESKVGTNTSGKYPCRRICSNDAIVPSPVPTDMYQQD